MAGGETEKPDYKEAKLRGRGEKFGVILMNKRGDDREVLST